jgi:hypothetical protein
MHKFSILVQKELILPRKPSLLNKKDKFLAHNERRLRKNAYLCSRTNINVLW